MDVDALAWQAAVVGGGGTVTPGRVNNVSNFIIALKAASVWPKLDRFFYLRGQNATQAKFDFVARASLTVVGSPVFTANLGYATFRVLTVENYLDTGTAGGTNYTLNGAHVGFYLNTNLTNEDGVESGSSDTGTNYLCNLSVAWSDGNTYSAINDANTDTGRPRPTDVTGHWVYNRSGSTANQIYQLGSLFASPNQTSTVVPTKNFAIGTAPDAAGAFSQGFTQSPNPQFSAWHIGGNLSAGDVSVIKTALDVLIASLATEDELSSQMMVNPPRPASSVAASGWTYPNQIIRSGAVQAPLSNLRLEGVRFVASSMVAVNSQPWVVSTPLSQSGGGAKPQGSDLVDPVRFTASYLIGVNSQWWLDASSQQLYLKSQPELQTSADLPKIAGRLLPDQNSSPLVLLATVPPPALPPGRQFLDVRLTYAQPQPWTNPSSQLLYLNSQPAFQTSADLQVRLSNPWPAILSQLSPDQLLTIPAPSATLPAGQRSYDVNVVLNPWAALNSQWYLETSNQGLYLKSNPLSAQYTDNPRLQTNRALDVPQLGTPLLVIHPPVAVSLPPGHQMFDLRLQPNPWVAISSQKINNPFNPQNPPVSVPGSEYIYYAHHKGIR